MRNARLDELLGAGPLPPRAALELAVRLVDAMDGQAPLGSDTLRADRIAIGGDGAVSIERRGASSAEAGDTRRAIGALLYHALIGVPWQDDPARRGRQLDDLRGQMAFWPDGGAVAALVDDLLGPGGFSGVRARLEALRERAAGPELSEWHVEATLRLTGDTVREAPVVSIDSLTASIPVGALRKQPQVAATAGPVLKVTPAGAPLRKPAPPHVSSASGAAPYVLVGLLAVALVGTLGIAIAALVWLT